MSEDYLRGRKLKHKVPAGRLECGLLNKSGVSFLSPYKDVGIREAPIPENPLDSPRRLGRIPPSFIDLWVRGRVEREKFSEVVND